MSLPAPRWRHDCDVWNPENPLDACRYVDTWAVGDDVYDFYVHPRPWGLEIVARFGDDGPDYYSGPTSYNLLSEFLEVCRT